MITTIIIACVFFAQIGRSAFGAVGKRGETPRQAQTAPCSRVGVLGPPSEKKPPPLRAGVGSARDGKPAQGCRQGRRNGVLLSDFGHEGLGDAVVRDLR